jgi:hypothetical protein
MSEKTLNKIAVIGDSEKITAALAKYPELKDRIEIISGPAEGDIDKQLRNIAVSNERFKDKKNFRRWGFTRPINNPDLCMPKKQPCPDCHASCKRVRRTISGAIYDCRTHGQFLVNAPDKSHRK